MSVQTIYQSWKNNNLGKVLGDGECVAASVSYTEAAFPGVDRWAILPSVEGAKDLANRGNQYLTWIQNDHNNPNQLPTQGDIMIFDATPQSGYTNTFHNPYGHMGECDSADSNGYSLTQQNAPNSGSPLNVTHYPWKFRPCLGWYHLNVSRDAPAPAPNPQVNIKITSGQWNVRSSPEVTSSNIIKGANNSFAPALGGQQYGAVIQSNGWAQITFLGKTGYVGPSAFTKV